MYVARLVEWTGEGLPPVGTVCEVIYPGYSNERFDRFVGHSVTIVAHDVIDAEPVAVFRMPVNGRADEQDYHALVAKCFRPARTPEQIAAEEALREIEILYSEGGPAAVFDAGYRKQVKP